MQHVKVRTTVDPSEGRAKIAELDINGKHVNGPRRFVHINRNGDGDLPLFHDHINAPPVTEVYVQMRPATLRKILTDAREHQRIKDDIRRALEAAGNDSLNLLRIGLENQPVANEAPEDFRPHGSPTTPVLTKLFDLCDIEGVDAISLPVPTSNSAQWAKMGMELFGTRKPDFLDEVLMMGTIPISLPETDAANLLRAYRSANFEGVYVDFLGRKVPETWIRGLIDVDSKAWGKMFVAGGNVMADLSQGTWRKSTVATYDLLVQVYGFDAFANLRYGMGSDHEDVTTKKFAEMLARKRYRITNTYGAYNREGLEKYLENATHKCACPNCGNKNPVNLYDKFQPSESGLEGLRKALQGHRTFVTHTEMLELEKAIRTEKYGSHLAKKEVATNEIASIIKAVG